MFGAACVIHRVGACRSANGRCLYLVVSHSTHGRFVTWSRRFRVVFACCHASPTSISMVDTGRSQLASLPKEPLTLKRRRSFWLICSSPLGVRSRLRNPSGRCMSISERPAHHVVYTLSSLIQRRDGLLSGLVGSGLSLRVAMHHRLPLVWWIPVEGSSHRYRRSQ